VIDGYNEALSCSSFTSGSFDIDVIFHVHCTKPVWCVTTAWVDFCLMDIILFHSMTRCDSSRNSSMDLFSWTAGNKCLIFVERGKHSLMNANSLTTPARSWRVILSRNLPSMVHVRSLRTCANYNYVLQQNRNFRGDDWNFRTESTSNSALMHWCDKILH